MVWQTLPPRTQLLVDVLQSGREVARTGVGAPLGVYTAKNIAQDDREKTELSEG